MSSYLQKKNVNLELQTRIRNYLDYMHREERQLNMEETKGVIDKLSPQLQLELTKEVNTQYIQAFPLISSNLFSKKTQELSVFVMKDQKYMPGELIFSVSYQCIPPPRARTSSISHAARSRG